MSLFALYKLFRRNSYPILSILLVGILAYFWVIKSYTFGGLAFVSAIGVFLLFNWIWLKPGHSSLEAKEVLTGIGNGQPTFLNIYSNT